MPFKPRQRTAQCRSRELQLLCRSRQRARLCDRNKPADIIEIEVIHLHKNVHRTESARNVPLSLSQYCVGAILHCAI
jgi:hypothetical protein